MVGFRSIGASVVTCFVLACRPACEHDIRQSASAPDRRYVATVFVENCHATAPFVTMVNVRRASDEFDADDHVFAAKGSVAASVAWTSPHTLVIRAEEAEHFRRESHWREVSVMYEPLPAVRR